jgi:hypothetical protein
MLQVRLFLRFLLFYRKPIDLVFTVKKANKIYQKFHSIVVLQKSNEFTVSADLVLDFSHQRAQ